MRNITVEQLKSKLDSGEKPVLLDVREEWEFATCHIEGSININMSNIESNLNELNATAETIVICHHGMRSYQVADYLYKHGYMNIANLEGGVDAWSRKIDTIMPQY